MTEYYASKIEELFKEFKTSNKGLSKAEVENRKRTYGLNKLERKKKASKLSIFLRQFKSFLILILIVAAIVSALIGFMQASSENLLDAVVILAIVMLNAIIGFVQEYKAERAMEALEKLSAPKARVIRAGKKQRISSIELVPGDILLLEVGDKVPADARIIWEMNLQVNESALTGESLPVNKTAKELKKENLAIGDQRSMVFTSTIVTAGRAHALVVETGMKTQIGKIAELIQEAEEKPTPLQIKLQQLGKTLGIAIILICIAVFALEMFRGGDVLEVFMVAVSLAVAAVPEGLPAIITISLAIGLEKMAHSKAIVKELPAVETLGSTTAICSDKTGTLTRNEMTVTHIYANEKTIRVTGSGYVPRGEFRNEGKELDTGELETLLKIGALCNNAELVKEEGEWDIFGDPTEGSLIVVAEKAGINHKSLKKEYPRIHEINFTSERKRMSTVHKSRKGYTVFAKGAPEVLLEHCSRIWLNGKVRKLSAKDKKEILDETQDMAKEALRVLALSYREFKKNPSKLSPKKIERELVFVGLVGMIDPPRQRAKKAIELCENAGIRVIMITGDHELTAHSIAEQLGLIKRKSRVLTGTDIDSLSDEKLRKKVREVSIYARVSPEHKVRILKALQANGEIVAMTGDGVNDAPALTNANIGVSMGIKGTDVAIEASDMILEDDNFATIVKAVEEGRAIYDNIKKFVNYLLTSNAGEILIIFIAALIGLPLPLIAVQILWINLLTDGLPAVALSIDPAAPGIMKRKPRDPREKTIDKSMFHSIILIGIIMCIGTLAIFNWALSSGASIEKARTLALATVVLFEVVRIQVVRAEYKVGFLSNKYLILALVSSLALLGVVIYVPILQPLFKTVPLALIEWAYVAGIAITVFIAIQIKILIQRAMKV